MSLNGRELLHRQLARRPTSYTTKAAADEELAIFKATIPEQLAVHVKERLHPGDLPMLIRSEGVGLRPQNRRERGKNKKTKNKHAFCFRYMLSKIVCLGGGEQGGQ